MGKRTLAHSAQERRSGFYLTLAFLMFGVLILGVGVSGVWAAFPEGISCSNCHTMHNSQGGISVFADGPQEALLSNTCIGCHSGQNSGGDIPYVFSASTEPSYGATGTEAGTNTLAGGNFYWVAQPGGDSAGHNVSGLVPADSTLTVPPGFGSGLAAADGTVVGNGGGWPSGTQLTCAGVYGCHGSHDQDSAVQAIQGAHHSATSNPLIPGQEPTAANSYRMLVGIAGYEDSDWEYLPTSAAHNQYKGVDGPGGTDESTISYLCAQCHGQFHQSGQTSSPWLRHPTDYDMANSNRAEYDAYNGGNGTDNAYSVIAPVASASVNVVLSTVTPASDGDDDTIVTCISCHRAHGTKYYKLMRWDYANSAGGDCAICHTSKG